MKGAAIRNSKISYIIFTLLLLAVCFSAAAKKREPLQAGPYYAPEKWVTVDGMKICYIEAGQGPVVLLVHGWCGNIYNWMSVFEAMSRQNRVIAIDLPGSGKSGCDKKACFTTPCYADFLLHFMDALKIEKASLVGSSMGGQVVAWFAVKYPQRTDKLVLVDAAGTSSQNGMMKLGSMIISPQTVIPLIHTVFPVKEETLARVPESERKRVELAEALYRSDRRPCVGQAMSQSMKSVSRDILDQRLGEIKAQTLVIWGSNDPLLNVEGGHIYQAGIPNAKLEIIENGDHTAMQWTPEAFLKVIEPFLAK